MTDDKLGKEPTRFDRREVLKTTGIALAGLTSMGAASADSSLPSEPNEPNIVNQGQGGYAIGNHNNPVTSKTIHKIQSTLMNNLPEQRDKEQGIILSDPTAKPLGGNVQFEKEMDKQNIIGFAMKWEDGVPHTKVKRDTLSEPVNPDVNEKIRDEAHAAVQNFASNGDGS